ncbi:MAG: hypothetical protein ISQ22_01700 [Rhizobiales bacterium]|jgi:hypothetical protein|nr:hypothetical protein [Hyphomicrobiales bacterium]MBL6770076.1 hypothetical protein [Hyphomicrobiales bacterium]
MNILNTVLNSSEKKSIRQLAPKPSAIIPDNTLHNRYLFIMIILLCYLKSIILTSLVSMIGSPEFSALSINLVQIGLLSWIFIAGLILAIISFIIIYGTHTSIIYNKNTINLLIHLGASNSFIIQRIVFTFLKIGLLSGIFGSVLGFVTFLIMNPFLLQIGRLLNDLSQIVEITNRSSSLQYIILLSIPILSMSASTLSSYLTVRKLIRKYN